MVFIRFEPKFRYTAFGFRIASEIEFPELLPGSDRGPADIEIGMADLLDAWKEEETANRIYRVQDNRVLFHFPDVAIASISDGRKIGVCPLPGVDERLVRLYILGSCMGAVLFQKRILPLHGSAIVIGGRAYAIVGNSGAGKSTLAAAFVERGYSLLTDDVIAVSVLPEAGGVPHVIPAYPQQKLWQESISLLEIQASEYRPLWNKADKFGIPVVSKFASEPIPLAGIFELTAAKQSGVQLHPVERLESLPLLRYHTYRNFLIAPLHLEQWHFDASVAIARATPIYRLTRSSGEYTLHELPGRILQTVEKESIVL
ncbi:aldolase [Cohnella massiliensis]|uniref:aldolase n=1 Tax=Cohnella massiliensis TaxID=1816691 RepID=UPI001FEB02C5|nr:aldolase [Cohnella massiliensis]